jgi:ribonuclease T2
MRHRAGLLCLAVALLALPGSMSTVWAQARAQSGCILDRCQDRDDPNAVGRRSSVPNRPAAPSRPGAATGNFDFYVLSLSWSSGFCATTRSQRDSDQCRSGAGHGFVVHGLWPQFERGFPSDCDTVNRPLTRQALDIARGLFPDEGLARYEWRKHGTCTGRAPTDYFSDVRSARDQVAIPDTFAHASAPQRASPADIVRAFEAANPRLRPGMMAVGCTRGVLQEVRICFSKDLRGFRLCPEVVRNSCRGGDIPPVL